MVVLQFGRVLSVLFQGDDGKNMKVYTTVLLLNAILSGAFVAPYKFPKETQFLFALSDQLLGSLGFGIIRILLRDLCG